MYAMGSLDHLAFFYGASWELRVIGAPLGRPARPKIHMLLNGWNANDVPLMLQPTQGKFEHYYLKEARNSAA